MFKHYLTTALRHFRRHKLTTSINVICLTIGFICFLAIYTIVTFITSADRHYANADRIYMLTSKVDTSPSVAFAPYLATPQLRTDFPELEAVARVTFDTGYASEIPVAVGERKGFVHVAYADPELLTVFALPFLEGDAKSALNSPRSAVISRDTAILYFGGVHEALGRRLRLQDGNELTVQGVVDRLTQPSHMATGTDNALAMVRFDLMISMDVFEAEALIDPLKSPFLKRWNSFYFGTYLVLPRDGSLSVKSLRDRLIPFADRHANSSSHRYTFNVVSVNEFAMSMFGMATASDKTGISPAMTFYFLGVIVLLISCLNYANLATAQASTRAKEIGMRRVVGARRGQIVAQFMMEAALLSMIALLGALLLITALIYALRSTGVAATVMTVAGTAGFWLTLFALLVAVTLAAGIYPAFILSSVRPTQAIRAGKSRTGGRFATSLMVSLQFSGASILLISMFVMHSQGTELRRAALNGAGNPFVVVSNNVRAAGVDYDVLRTELLRQPHIQAVTASLLSPWVMASLRAETLTPSLDKGARSTNATQSQVHYEFFSTLGMKVLAGRAFDREHDDVFKTSATTGANGSNIVIDRALAEQNGWSHPADAIGQTIFASEFGNTTTPPAPRTVIGVVENRPMSIVSPMQTTANVYVLSPVTASYPIIRISPSDGGAALKEIESVWNTFAPSVALKMQFADQVLQRNYVGMDMMANAFGGIATLALLISVLGLIGMSIHVIARRRHEIGIRKTLGADVQSVVSLLLADFSKPVFVANLIAWPIAFMAMKLYLRFFAQQTSLSVAPFIASFVITILIAWISVAAQATRAARMNPATVLRCE